MAALDADTVRDIASRKRHDACLQLARHIGWESSFVSGASQQIMMVDYLYDVIMHTVNKGLPWEQVCVTYTLAYEMISATKDNSLPDAIRIFKKHCEPCQNKISLQNLKVFTDYFFSTFFAHYKLYQYVFNKEQEKQIVNVELTVETMPELQPFSDAKDISIWEYEKKVEDVDKTNEKRKAEREQENLTARKHHEEDVNKALEMVEDNQSLSDKEKLIEIIQSVASAHIGAVSQALVQTVEETMEELEYQLERTALPRPNELGAPPRLKTKTPLSAAPKRQKSATRVKSGGSRTGQAKKGKGK